MQLQGEEFINMVYRRRLTGFKGRHDSLQGDGICASPRRPQWPSVVLLWGGKEGQSDWRA